MIIISFMTGKYAMLALWAIKGIKLAIYTLRDTGTESLQVPARPK